MEQQLDYILVCHVCVCPVDIQVLLMTDILVFLQEKDQRYIFPCLVSKYSHIHIPHWNLITITNGLLSLFLALYIYFPNNPLLCDPGQTSSAVSSEPDSEGYSQSGARHVPHQWLLPSWDVWVPCCNQGGQERLDPPHPAHRQQVGKCTNTYNTPFFVQ